MGRDKLLAALRELSDRGHGAAGFKPHYAIEQEILAEFDRLKAEVDRWQKLADKEYWGRVSQEEANEALQSQLDRISEPYSQARYNFDLEGIENSLHGRGYWYSAKSLRAIRDYLGSQKPSEKQHTYSHWYRRKVNITSWHILKVFEYCVAPFSDEFHFDVHEGKPEADCPMCNPKPLTQCPECHGTKYINRVVSCADWELHPIYVIATCLNCKGEGVI